MISCVWLLKKTVNQREPGGDNYSLQYLKAHSLYWNVLFVIFVHPIWFQGMTQSPVSNTTHWKWSFILIPYCLNYKWNEEYVILDADLGHFFQNQPWGHLYVLYKTANMLCPVVGFAPVLKDVISLASLWCTAWPCSTIHDRNASR